MLCLAIRLLWHFYRQTHYAAFCGSDTCIDSCAHHGGALQVNQPVAWQSVERLEFSRMAQQFLIERHTSCRPMRLVPVDKLNNVVSTCLKDWVPACEKVTLFAPQRCQSCTIRAAQIFKTWSDCNAIPMPRWKVRKYNMCVKRIACT